MAGVTPTQLYGLLVPTTERTEHASRRARRFRYGRARMVVHFALSRQPDWIGEPMLADTATIT